MGKTVWIALGIVILAIAAYAAYSFVETALLDPQRQLPANDPLYQPPPADAFCVSLGGKPESRRWFTQEIKVCVLPTGEQCDQTTLYERNECVAP